VSAHVLTGHSYGHLQGDKYETFKEKFLMLLLDRHQTESVVIHKDDEPDKALVIRVTEVLPTGDVTLGFIGDGYTVVRQEIFSPEDSHKYKRRSKEDNGTKYSSYHS